NTSYITTTSKSAKALSLWKNNAPLKKELVSYIKSVTDVNSKDYIPVENRIAVFDMDGTLCCETDPGYFDHKLLYHRVMEDPAYKDKASKEEIETCKEIKTYFETGVYPKGMDMRHGKAVSTAFAGMTLDEFDAYVKSYREQPMEGYTNMTSEDSFYKPMLQVISYLQANNFKVYIVSGTDRLITRGLADGIVNIPKSQMIGSDELFVASNQAGEDGLNYTFSKDDKLITSGEFVIKNLKMNKVCVIAQEIGEQPVLCFGNSSGDEAMANYTINNNKYKSAAFMLCCDDTTRENGNIEKADKMRESCEKNGYIPISMKNDWKTIYGTKVKRVAKK
ncbi:MAG: haloacid dehalogenase-like hydrolase, partial [Bacilli bacterium]|nr:haloacid dehalogenase-like hydrolase [Bacilli bacterium]